MTRVKTFKVYRPMLEADVFIVEAESRKAALQYVEDNVATLERDSFEQMDNSDGDPWAVEVPSVTAYHGLCCPKCGEDDQLDVFATVAVRLTPEGSDVDESVNGDHEWGDESLIVCHHEKCNCNGFARHFRAGGS